jgi:RNA-directed DNA polymerase
MDKAILLKWLKSGYMEKNVFFDTKDGTPQGGIISPVLANIALDGLESQLREKFPAEKRNLKGQKACVNLVRYADDFIITGRTKELLETEIKPLVEQFMRKRGLELSQEKTVITHIEGGFDFLGQNVRKYKRTLLIKPSKKNVKTFLEGIRKVIKDNKQATAYALIAQLNPKIRGWANYHRYVVSKDTFNYVDFSIFKTLCQWAIRRHPSKPYSWVKKKYFDSIQGNNWRFTGTAKDKNGKPIQNWICRAVKTPIVRHTKIKGEANPYDPEWETYFEERLGVKMANNLRGRRQLSRLWREQQGICPICNQLITKLTGWHNHHIVQRVRGGTDTSDNRVLLHPNCHRQVHAFGLSVSKPRPVKRASRKA